MNKSKLGALIMLVALSSLAQASVLSDALDCKKKFDYSAVNAELDRLGTFKSIDNQLVYTLKTPFKYGSAEIAKFTISENLLDGHFKNNIGYKKAFALLPASNTLKKDKEEAKEQLMYWKAWTVKKTDFEARIQQNELENKTIVGCSWSEI